MQIDMLEKEVLFFDPWSAIVQTIFSCKSLDLAKAEYQSGFFWPGNLMLFVAEREGELSFVVLELMNSFIFVFEIGFDLQKGKKVTEKSIVWPCPPPIADVTHRSDCKWKLRPGAALPAYERASGLLSSSRRRGWDDCRWYYVKHDFLRHFQ